MDIFVNIIYLKFQIVFNYLIHQHSVLPRVIAIHEFNGNTRNKSFNHYIRHIHNKIKDYFIFYAITFYIVKAYFVDY